MSKEASRGVRSVGQLVSGRFAAQAVLLVSAFLIPRHLGAETYGHYVAWMAIVAIVRSGVSLGIPMVEVRFLAPLWAREDRAEAVRLGSTIWIAKLGLSLLGGLLVISWVALSPELSLGLGLAAALGFMAFLNYVNEGAISLLLPLGRVGSLSVFLVIRAALTLVAVLVGFSMMGLAGVVWGLVGLYFLLALASWRGLTNVAALSLRDFRWASLSRYMPFALAVYVGTVAWAVQGQFSIYAVAKWATSEQAGYLGLTLQFYAFVQVLFLSGKRALTPILAELESQGDERRLCRWGESMLRYSIAVSSVVLIGWVFVGRDVIHLVFSDAFLPVYQSATMILVCSLFFCAAESCSILLYIRGHARLASANLVLYAVLTVLGVGWALQGQDSGTVFRVSMVYVAAAVTYAATTYLSLAMASGMRLPLARSAFLMLPVATSSAALWDAPVGVRVVILLTVLGSYAALAIGLGLLPRSELQTLLSRIRVELRGLTALGSR